MLKFIFILLFSGQALATSGQVRLPKLISNGMVLQRNVKLKIWGWASPNEAVRLQFKNQAFKSKADEKGNWSIQMPSQKAGGPYQMTIKASNEINITDILIGDVWVCSGQSNMELWMNRLKYKYPEEIATADNPFIRQLLVPDKYNFESPQKDMDAVAWLSVNQQNIGAFSAIAYFFAKEIYAKYKIPVGLINSALGGSPAEAWISESALKQFPAYYNEAQKLKDSNLISKVENNNQMSSNNWYQLLNEKDEGLKNNWRNYTPDGSWKPIKVPGYWAGTDAGFFNGSAWFSKRIIIPASMTGKPAKLELGRIVDADSVFINGQLVGATGYQYPPRRYELAPSVLKEGVNTIVIRVISNSGKGGFVPGKRYELTTLTDTIDLKGEWNYQTGAVMQPLPPPTFIRWKPGGLYNAMIAPLTNYPIKGVLWFQGESNASRPDDYKALMQTLIEDWRDKWKQGNFPFLFVQLANFMEAQATPQESSWAALRQQQLNTLAVPNTAMAVAIDVGEWNDIHPENKQAVGHRLALLAEKNVYGGQSLVASGPLYQSMTKEGNRIIITFSNTGSGLMIKDGNQLKHFAIAGTGKKYLWAKALIKNNKVIVWNDEIKNPVSVRYAWADNPEGANLYNKEGLPASPFTTDK